MQSTTIAQPRPAPPLNLEGCAYLGACIAEWILFLHQREARDAA